MMDTLSSDLAFFSSLLYDIEYSIYLPERHKDSLRSVHKVPAQAGGDRCLPGILLLPKPFSPQERELMSHSDTGLLVALRWERARHRLQTLGEIRAR